MPPASPAMETLAPGSVVVVRDEEWLVTSATKTSDGWLVEAQGLSELVRDTTAAFYDSLDTIEPLDPSQATVIADDSPHYRRSRLWLEATLRKTPIPLDADGLSVATEALADNLGYQLTAVRRALDPEKLRPRVLLADAVGLGKTLEIGMILSELVRRGRGERILIISPRHVLEQMQHEMWSRFALPFVRLDSLGIQRVRQRLPATRNPFAYYKRIIVSIDTLKSDRYAAHLHQQPWDATRASGGGHAPMVPSHPDRGSRKVGDRPSPGQTVLRGHPWPLTVDRVSPCAPRTLDPGGPST